ncbi:MAG: hypothetical protein KDD55_06415 [Bdellovibrionales bacterium]|nr:hypothetical protein [Bdellovibrionales bacterium]
MTTNHDDHADKSKLLDTLLDGDHVMIHLDARAPGVDIPEHLGRNHDLTLKISRRFRGRLELTENQIETELLFNEGYYPCTIPFAALWGVTDENGESKIWPYSTPKELLESILVSDEAKEHRPHKPQLSVATSHHPAEEALSSSDQKKGRPQLKRIK